MVCMGCVAVIIVVVLTLRTPGFLDGTLVVLSLSAPLLIPVLFSFGMHTELAHQYNAGPALFYTGIIVLMRLVIGCSFAATMIIGHFILLSSPVTGICIIASWASAWTYRNPRDLPPGRRDPPGM